MAGALWNVWTEARLGIDVLDNGKSSVCHMRQNRNWTEQSGRVIDQIKKCRKTSDPKTTYRKDRQVTDLILYSILRTQSHHEGEYEQSHCVSDHAISQQDRGDN